MAGIVHQHGLLGFEESVEGRRAPYNGDEWQPGGRPTRSPGPSLTRATSEASDNPARCAHAHSRIRYAQRRGTRRKNNDLLSDARLKFDDFLIVYDISNLNWPTADFAVFDVGLASNRRIQYDR